MITIGNAACNAVLPVFACLPACLRHSHLTISDPPESLESGDFHVFSEVKNAPKIPQKNLSISVKSYTQIDYNAYTHHHTHDYTQDKEGVLPVELTIAIALLVIGAGIWVSCELTKKQKHEWEDVIPPTTPPPAVVNIKSQGKAARRMRRGTGFMGRKI